MTSEETTMSQQYLELGDRILIDSKQYGKIVGKIYYRDESLIRVMSDNVTDILYDFPRVYTETEDKFSDELGVKVSYIFKKRNFDSFVLQHNLTEGNVFETILPDRTPGETYKIISVDEESDSIETDKGHIEFGFAGIPRELPFIIIRLQGIGTSFPILKPSDTEEIPAEPETSIEIIGSVYVPIISEYKEIEEKKKIYSRAIQKVDALNDFISMLDVSSQKNPSSIRSIRILVESIYELISKTIEYNIDETFKNFIPNAAKTLQDFMKTHSSHLSLSRPVLNISKKLYKNKEEEDDLKNEQYYTTDFNKELDKMQRNPTLILSETNIRFWKELALFLKEYTVPWAEISRPPIFEGKRDGDFFRGYPDVDSHTIDGYLGSKAEIDKIIGKIKFSYNRFLSPSFRKSSTKGKHTLLTADSTSIDSHIMFPLTYSAILGNTRTGNLARDSARSHTKFKTMHRILLEKPKTIQISTSPTESILLSEFIKNITQNDESLLVATSLNDISHIERDIGLGELEWTEEQLSIFHSVFNTNMKKYYTYISRLRNELKNIEETSHPMEEEAEVEKWIELEDILSKELNKFKHSSPLLARSDLAKTAHLITLYPAYFQLSLTGKEEYLSRERLLATRFLYLQELEKRILFNKKEKNVGEKPTINLCEHVAKLVSIRKIKNINERYQTMIKFFTKYQNGRMENNYFLCSICERNLLCAHEIMQIKAILNPKEQEIIRKNLILTFAGGLFSGHYICRSCGQSMEELQLDTHLEYDDNGRPMMGRSVLVDYDEAEKAELDAVFEIVSNKKNLDFGTSLKNKYYVVIREISEKMGIFIEKEAYDRIINRLSPLLESAAMKSKEIDYAINLVCGAGILLLIEIQTHDYSPKFHFHGCVPSFSGMPLEDSGDSGMRYITCIIANITLDTFPWNITGFMSSKKTEKERKESIFKQILLLKNYFTTKNIDIRDELLKRKEHVSSLHEEGVKKEEEYEKIPSSFLPDQFSSSSLRKFVENEPPKNGKHIHSHIKYWIHQATIKAGKEVVRNLESNSVCCLRKIGETSDEYWLERIPLVLPSRKLNPEKSEDKYIRGDFEPRSLHELSVDVPEDLLHRLFLKVCFRGPRIGRFHEPNLSFRCMWCEFQFPEDPNLMNPDTNGKKALVTQQINIGKESFTKLLELVRRINRIDVISTSPKIVVDLWDELHNMEYPVVDEWKKTIEETKQKLLTANTNQKIVSALGSLSQLMETWEEKVSNHLPDNIFDDIKNILKLPWQTVYSIFLTYFIIPFKRILTNFEPDSLFVSSKLKEELSRDHVKYLKKILDKDSQTFNTIMREYIYESEYNKKKIEDFIKKSSSISKLKDQLRSSQLDKRSILYIQRTFIWGLLGSLFHVDNNATISETDLEISQKFMTNIIVSVVDKYNSEKLPYDEKKIREMIEDRNEKEKTLIIGKMNVMSEDMLAVTMMSKYLGIGDWAIGGSSAIYAYDPKQYDRESKERLDAGIVDFTEKGVGIEKPTIDPLGISDYSSEPRRHNEGYTHDQDVDDA